ncbi:MAG: hypothetical protein ACI9UJ_002438 [bacterium]|jgi:hypothetical protein
MVEKIKGDFEGDVFSDGRVFTADTGYCSESNLAFLHEQNTAAVIPDNNFRLRGPVYSESESFAKHKKHRQATRKDHNTTRKVSGVEAFVIDFEKKEAVCQTVGDADYLA